MTRTNPLAEYTNVTPKTFNTKSENAESKEGIKSVIEKYLEMGYRNLTASRSSSLPGITGMRGSPNSEGKIDPTIPEKNIDASNKPNSDGALDEALPLLAGASVGTALCYTALAIGGTVALPFLIGGGALVLSGAILFGAYRGGAEVYNYFNKEQPPKVDTPPTKVELVHHKPTFEPPQHKESIAKVTRVGGVTILAI